MFIKINEKTLVNLQYVTTIDWSNLYQNYYLRINNGDTHFITEEQYKFIKDHIINFEEIPGWKAE